MPRSRRACSVPRFDGSKAASRELLPAAREAHQMYATGFPGTALLLARMLAEHQVFHDEARALLSDFA